MPPRRCISRKLESDAELGLEPRYSDFGCRCPEWNLETYTNADDTKDHSMPVQIGSFIIGEDFCTVLVGSPHA